MKRIISLMLTLLMIFSVCSVGVVAIGDINKPTNQIAVHSIRSQIPVIRILGDGEPLYNAEQEKIFHIRSLTLNSSSDDDEDSDVMSSVANILLPFLINGLLKDEWDAYYENLQKEISDIFSEIILDGDGNPVGGTGISQARKDEMARYETTEYLEEVKSKGYYGINDYRFWYDWRLDPLYTADLLHEHIKLVREKNRLPKSFNYGKLPWYHCNYSLYR